MITDVITEAVAAGAKQLLISRFLTPFLENCA